MHAPLSQAIDVRPSLAKVVRTFILAPDKVRNLPYSVTFEVRNFPLTSEQDNMAGKNADDDSSSSEVDRAPDIKWDATLENPWRLLGFNDISHADAVRQHPTDVIANLRRLSRQHHPDKHAADPETKERQKAIMRKLITARQMILVKEVLENGLPRPGTNAQTMREHYADKFLTDPEGSQTDNMRRHTKQSFTTGRAMIFAGKKIAHTALMSAYCRMKRNKSVPPASRALAIVQEGAFLRLDGRPVFEVPPGLTTYEAVEQINE